jgi:hypothetical protein
MERRLQVTKGGQYKKLVATLRHLKADRREKRKKWKKME